MSKVDIAALRQELKDLYGDDEHSYHHNFYGAISWNDVRSMMLELEALREVAIAAEDVVSAHGEHYVDDLEKALAKLRGEK